LELNDNRIDGGELTKIVELYSETLAVLKIAGNKISTID